MTSRTSRRSFLKAALAASAAPLILPSRVWSADTKPNDRLNVGVIGVGKQAHLHLSKLLGRSDAQIVAVCDVDTNRRNDGKRIVEQGYAKKTGGDGKSCDSYHDFRNVLWRKDIDAVVIVVPDHWHAFISIAAAEAGKDIYCEKPLTETIHEAKAVIAATRKADRVFQVGSQQRSSREFRVACELVRNGVIGKVSKVMAGFGAPAKWCDLPEEPVEEGLDWDRWLGPAPKRPYNSILAPRGVHTHFPLWREYWEYGGGYVTDWGAHHVDIAQWGLGIDANSGPVEMIPPKDWQTAKAGGKLIYADGCELEHIEQNGVTFFGDKGTIYVNRGVCQFIIDGKEVALFKALKSPEKPETPLSEQLDGVEKEFLADAKVKLYHSDDHHADWIACIKSRKRPIVDVETGARSAIACHLLNIGYRYGQTVKWEPEKIDFASGSGDPKWLTREYRDPWRVT